MAKKQLNKKVPGFPGYSVSPDGVVYSTKRGGQHHTLSPSLSSGYAQVKFSNGDIKKNYQVHRLVAELFIPNPKKLDIVNHIDGDKLTMLLVIWNGLTVRATPNIMKHTWHQNIVLIVRQKRTMT